MFTTRLSIISDIIWLNFSINLIITIEWKLIFLFLNIKIFCSFSTIFFCINFSLTTITRYYYWVLSGLLPVDPALSSRISLSKTAFWPTWGWYSRSLSPPDPWCISNRPLVISDQARVLITSSSDPSPSWARGLTTNSPEPVRHRSLAPSASRVRSTGWSASASCRCHWSPESR